MLREFEQKIAPTDNATGIFEMIKGLPSAKIERRETLPSTEAVYVVWASDKIFCIGQSSDLHRTFDNHHRLVEFLGGNATIAWFDGEESSSNPLLDLGC